MTTLLRPAALGRFAPASVAQKARRHRPPALATGDRDGEVSLWEMASAGRVRRTLRGHAISVSGVSFHPDGARLVSCGFDGQVKVWDWRAGVELLTLTRPGGGQLWHAVFSPDGKSIAAAGGDGNVTLWQVE